VWISAFTGAEAARSVEDVVFLAEFYVPGTHVDPAAIARRAGAAAAELTLGGTPVHVVRANFVPGDEVGFVLYEADSSRAVAAAGARAEIPFDRIREAVAFEPGTPARLRSRRSEP
jgi:hypothetical protein